jgi:alpha-tubulin suppressor-like RCC1 family protein
MALTSAQALVGGGGSAQASAIPLSGARITVAGPTNKTVTSTTASGGFFNLVVDGLQPGSYSITVEGLVGSQVAHFGQTSGVTVTAGNSTQASVTFPSFQPAIADVAVVDTAEVLRYTIAYGAVSNATSYIVEWSTSPTFVGASSKTVTGTSTEITVPNEGKYYIAVKAVNAVVTAGGLASPVKGVYLLQGVASVTVSPGAQTVAAGATLQLTAEGRDADNAVVPNVTWFWSSENQAVARVSQSGLVTGVAGGAVTITAVGKGMPGSTGVTVTAPSPTKLAFSIQPSNSTAGDALSPAVQVEIQDASGNRITDARDAVTIAFGTNAGGGTLAGTKVVNAINGIASFSGLWVNKSGTGYTLAASAGTMTGATSTGFNIVAGAPAKLAFSQQPNNVQGNSAINPAVTVTIADQFDNAVNTATSSVTIGLATNPWKTPFSPGAALSGGVPQTVAAVAGVATFSTLRIDKPAPGYALGATSGSLNAATSNAFNVNLTVSQVSAASSGSHSCAVTLGGTYCWGYNGSGQLGVPTTSTFQDSIPVLVRTNQSFTSVTVNGSHSCGLTAAGAAYCWGYNGNGQLGNNSTTPSDVPVAVAGGHVFVQIDAGAEHTCAVTGVSATAAEDRQVYCWGYNFYGQIGDGTSGNGTNKLVPTRIADPLRTQEATSVSAGAYHSCARAPNGNAYCWGYNQFGQLGDATVLDGNGNGGINQPLPTLVAGGISWASVNAGQYHTCGISANPGSPASCWGRNNQGQLGNQTILNSSSPVAVFGGFAWSAVSGGGNHTCGFLTTGKGYCWGNNGSGELGDDNSPTDATQPVEISPIELVFTGLESGSNHSCGRTATATYCWGYNGNGALGSPGTGSIKKVATPIVQ